MHEKETDNLRKPEQILARVAAANEEIAELRWQISEQQQNISLALALICVLWGATIVSAIWAVVLR